MVAGACNLSYLGGWGRRIAWTWQSEVAVSQDGTTALQPGAWVTEQDSISEKKNLYSSIEWDGWKNYGTVTEWNTRQQWKGTTAASQTPKSTYCVMPFIWWSKPGGAHPQRQRSEEHFPLKAAINQISSVFWSEWWLMGLLSIHLTFVCFTVYRL